MEDGFDLFSTSYIPAKQVAAIDAKAKAEAEAELARKRFEAGYSSLVDWYREVSRIIYAKLFADLTVYGGSPAYIIHDSIYFGWDLGYEPTKPVWHQTTPTFVKVPHYRPGTAHFTQYQTTPSTPISIPLTAEPFWVSLNQRKPR